jgi:hypothetical protein
MFKLNAPVSFTESSREKPKNYYSAVERTLNNRLGGDVFYSGLVTKNPLNPYWVLDYCNASYTLEELSEYCGTLDDSIQLSIDISFKEGRNCQLFDQVRNWAYMHIKDYSSFIQWNSAILSHCENENQFNPPLPYSEIKSVAKSISKWTWARRFNLGIPKNRGAAHLNSSLSIQEKKSHGATYTNQLRKTKSETLIIHAAQVLIQKGVKVGGTAIAREANVSRSTAHNYRHLWNSM